jgi:metal-responsive CopG/Arc/MetJ family transcriptional regulator
MKRTNLKREQVFLTPEMIQALDQLAIKKGLRARSALVRLIVTEYLNAQNIESNDNK